MVEFECWIITTRTASQLDKNSNALSMIVNLIACCRYNNPLFYVYLNWKFLEIVMSHIIYHFTIQQLSRIVFIIFVLFVCLFSRYDCSFLFCLILVIVFFLCWLPGCRNFKKFLFFILFCFVLFGLFCFGFTVSLCLCGYKRIGKCWRHFWGVLVVFNSHTQSVCHSSLF